MPCPRGWPLARRPCSCWPTPALTRGAGRVGDSRPAPLSCLDSTAGRVSSEPAALRRSRA